MLNEGASFFLNKRFMAAFKRSPIFQNLNLAPNEYLFQNGRVLHLEETNVAPKLSCDQLQLTQAWPNPSGLY